MVIPEAFTTTSSPDDTTWTVDRYANVGLQSWGTLEQSPVGEWWVTVAGATTTSTGPYLDEVQAMRALQAWGEGQ